jgi:hypothetical protein
VTGGTQGDVVIKDNSNVTFAAGESIVLSPGFSVEAGSTFQAYIKDFYCAPTTQMNMVSPSWHNNNPDTNQNANNKLQVDRPSFDTKFRPIRPKENLRYILMTSTVKVQQYKYSI